MQQNSTDWPNLKQLEQLLWRQLQETFSVVMKRLLEEIDQQIAEARDKKRYRLLGKRPLSFTSLFGELSMKRTYYRDRTDGGCVYLLDRYLNLAKAAHLSPMIEETAIELAIQGPSYRKAAQALETFLGYPGMSHETIRQHLLEISALPKAREPVQRQVLFVEVDGLYVKHQGKGKRGKEEKIAAVHQGWEVNGKRVRLKNKRHFIYRGGKPFWEAFEDFLIAHYAYDPTVHRLVINGDGAAWITACRDYFRDRAFFSIDRFHVAREIRRLFRDHPRFAPMKKALADCKGKRLLAELNSAVGTLGTEKKEEQLDQLIKQLEQYPEALGDYREWLAGQGIETTGMRPMGSAEGTMSAFAKRLKHGRSWVEKGKQAMMTGMVACFDQLAIQTLFGRMERWKEEPAEEKPPRHYEEKIAQTVGEEIRGNLPYLQGKAGIPVYSALTALQGF
jgi:hypothetical protein